MADGLRSTSVGELLSPKRLPCSGYHFRLHAGRSYYFTFRFLPPKQYRNTITLNNVSYHARRRTPHGRPPCRERWATIRNSPPSCRFVVLAEADAGLATRTQSLTFSTVVNEEDRGRSAPLQGPFTPLLWRALVKGNGLASPTLSHLR